MTSNVTVIDRDAEDRAWAEAQFDQMTKNVNIVWELAQGIEMNWDDGRNISRLYPGKTPSAVLKDRVHAHGTLDGRSTSLLALRLNCARAQRLAPPQFRGLSPAMYDHFKVTDETSDIERAFQRAEELGGISWRNMKVATGSGAAMKPPYWQQVIENLMTGAEGLTPATARNIIATAQRWLEDNPDADERR